MHTCMHAHMHVHMHACTHAHPFYSPGELVPEQIWILLKQETVSGSVISWAICKSAPLPRQITVLAPTTQFFTGRMPFRLPNQQHQSTGKTFLFSLHACESFSTLSLQVFFGLPLGQAPSTSYSIHFFTQSLSSFHSACPYHRNLFCCSTEIVI